MYPYEYMNSFEKVSAGKLLDKCNFLSSPKDECISEKYYQTAINVCNVFKMHTMSDYHDII